MAFVRGPAMEVSAFSRCGVRAPIIACRGSAKRRKLYRVAMTGEKSGPTSMIFPWFRSALCQVGSMLLKKDFDVRGGVDVRAGAANSGIKKRLGVDHVNTTSVHVNRGSGSRRLQQYGHAKHGNRSDQHCKPSSSPPSRRDTLALRQQY